MIPKLRSAIGLFGVLTVGLLVAQTAGAQSLYVKNARIYTVSNGIIERGSIVVESGKIKAVGVNLPVPSEARVIDASGKVVMPGIVDASGRFGMPGDDNEQSVEVTPDVRALHAFDPRSSEARRALQSGVTAVCLTPGTSNIVGGLCSVVKTNGDLSNGVVRPDVALRAALGSDVSQRNGGFRGAGAEALMSIYTRRPNSRMAAVWELRKALFEARQSAALGRVLKNELPLRVHARAENDLRVALTIADEFKVHRLILDDGLEAYKIPELIAARKCSVVLGPFYDPQTDLPEGAEGCLNAAGILSAAGVKVAFGSNGGDATTLLTWAALAARGGLAPDAALRAITLNAAEVTGVGGRLGSIQVGKDADLLILSGDPLDITSRIETVIVNGQVAYEDR